MWLPHTEVDVPGPPVLRVTDTEVHLDGSGTSTLALGERRVATVAGSPATLFIGFHDPDTFGMSDLVSYAHRSRKHSRLSLLGLIHYLGLEYALTEAIRQAETEGHRIGRVMSPGRDLLAAYLLPGPPVPLTDAAGADGAARLLYTSSDDPPATEPRSQTTAPPPVAPAGGAFEIWESHRWTRAPQQRPPSSPRTNPPR